MVALQEEIIITQNIRVKLRYGNLSPKEYLDVIRPYLRDLINKHKPIMELNNNNNSNNNNSNTNSNSNNNNSNNRAEWKIQLIKK